MALWLPRGRGAGEIPANPSVLKYRQDCANDTGGTHRSKDRATLLQIEAIACPEHQRYCSKGGIEYRPRERDPKAEEEHHGFCEQQMNWLADRYFDHLHDRAAFFIMLDFSTNAMDAVLLFKFLAIVQSGEVISTLLQVLIPLVQHFRLS